MQSGDWIRFVWGGCSRGKFCYFGREVIFRWCGFVPDRWVRCVRNNALHECRDPACRRPFGVRLNAAGVCSEMTPVGFYTCSPLHECRDPACRRPFGVRLNAAGVCSEMTPVGFYTCSPLLVCRDPACRRPFGVRLRGNVWLQRSPLHGDAAPLRMTQ